jgi:DNA-binding transcriptional LysR family regulator
MDTLDWTLIRSLLAVVDHGSLSAAARALGLSQPTLGRHVAEAQAALGLTLFTRTPQGLRPSEVMEALVPAARSMAEAANRLALAAAGKAEDVSGTVRLTASRVVSHHILPPVLARLRLAAPQIEIELVPSDTVENLLYREADIALRMVRPGQADLVARHLADLPLGLYAARDYLDRVGRPQVPEDLLALDFVGFDRSDQILQLMGRLGVPRTRHDFPVRCDDQLVYWNLVRAGLGVGGMQLLVGDADPLVERVDEGLVLLPPLPLWIAAAPGLRQTPRVARVWDFLCAELRVLGRSRPLSPEPPHLDPAPAIG